MKTGEIIGIAGGATVVGAIVWFIYGKTKSVKVSPETYRRPTAEEQKELDANADIEDRHLRIFNKNIKIGGGARSRSTKKTYNKNTKNTKNNSRKKRC